MTTKIQPLWILGSILRPIVRRCLKNSLKIHDIDELLRKIMIEEARGVIEEASGDVSVSKISLVTGINRAEVTRQLAGKEKPKGRHDLLQRVIGLWTRGRNFRVRSTGLPRALTYEGLSSEFALLVSGVSKEVSHYPVLFELERINAIEFRDGLVVLKVVEYIPQGDIEHGLEVLADDVGDLIDTVEANLSVRGDSPDLHLRTMFDNIDPVRLPTIRRWILTRGAEFHQRVCEYLASFDHDVNTDLPAPAQRARVVVSSFAHGSTAEPVRQLKPRKRGRKKKISSSKPKVS